MLGLGRDSPLGLTIAVTAITTTAAAITTPAYGNDSDQLWPFCYENITDDLTCSTQSDEWVGIYTDHCRIQKVNTSDAFGTYLIMSQTASTISFVGSVFCIITYGTFAQLRCPQLALELQLALIATVMAVKESVTISLHGGTMNYDPVTCCSTSRCLSEACFENFTGLAAILWGCCITVHAYLAIVLRLSPRAMRQVYKFFYLFGYGFPAVLSLGALFGGQLGPSGTFCWIPASRVAAQVGFYYIWAFLVDATIAAMLTHIGFAVRGTKISGGVGRFIAYAVWSVFVTLGFLVMRAHEWTHHCEDVSIPGLRAWNAFIYPLQGLGNAIIFTTNGNVIHAWKNVCKKRSERDRYDTQQTSDSDFMDVDAALELSVTNPASIDDTDSAANVHPNENLDKGPAAMHFADKGYSSDDSSGSL